METLKIEKCWVSNDWRKDQDESKSNFVPDI